MSKIILITDQHPLTIGNCPFELGTIEECVEFLKDQDLVGVDTETEGKDFTSKKIVMFQIGTEEVQYVIDTRTISIEPLREFLEGDATKIFHNVKFDYKFIKSNYNIEMKNIYDTMLAECVLNCGKDKYGYSLNHLTQRYLEVSLENRAVLAFADIEYNGLCFDKDLWLSNADINDGEVVKLEDELDNEIINNKLIDFISDYVQLDIFKPKEELRTVTVKWSSPIQVKKVMETYLSKRLENVNAFELYKFKDKPLIAKYLRYKEKQKISSTYGKSFLKYVMKDGKVRTSFWQVLNTGRVSSGSKEDRKPNMQNIPANNKFRNCFIARDGYSIVSVDYSGQELAIIAYGSQDPVWIKCRKNNEDLHSVCAELVFGDKWHNGDKKALRTMIKTINFGLAYGMSKFKLSDTLNISIDEADKLINKYFAAFPNIKSFLNKLGMYGVKNGHIRTFKPFRRIRWFPQWYKGIHTSQKDFKIKGAIERGYVSH